MFWRKIDSFSDMNVYTHYLSYSHIVVDWMGFCIDPFFFFVRSYQRTVQAVFYCSYRLLCTLWKTKRIKIKVLGIDYGVYSGEKNTMHWRRIKFSVVVEGIMHHWLQNVNLLGKKSEKLAPNVCKGIDCVQFGTTQRVTTSKEAKYTVKLKSIDNETR